jgi:cell division protein FtsB
MISKYEIEQASKIVESERKLKSEIAIKDMTIKNYRISNEQLKAENEELRAENKELTETANDLSRVIQGLSR